MVEPYRLPSAIILDVAADADVATVAIDISQEDYLTYPVAPASLRNTEADLLRPGTDGCLFELHQLIAREGTRLVFETYLATQSLPSVGGEYSFGSWWNHWAMDAVRDLSANWKRFIYPENGNHDHCLFTWETISSTTGQLEGYHSQHGWITLASYEEYIERDRFRIRRQWRSCENRQTHLHRIDE
jgi:hypothetical protein